MNTERVNSIADVPKIEGEISRIALGLKGLDDQIKSMSGIASVYKNASGPGELRKATDDLSKANEGLTNSQKQLQDALQKISALEKKLAEDRTANSKQRKQQTDEELRDSVRQQEEKRNRIAAIKAEGDAYKQLSLEYQRAANEAKKLQAVALRSDKTSDIKSADLATQKADALYQKLVGIDTKVGDFHRRVGNYNSVWEGWGSVGKQAIDKIDGGFKSMWSNIKNTAAAFIGITGLFEFGKSAIETFEKVEMGSARLENALHNLGASQKDVKQLNTTIDDLSQKFNYLGKTDLRDVQQKLVTYGKLNAEQITALMPTIINLAANARISVTEATDVIIKGMEGQSRALKLYGLDIKDAKTETERFNLIQTELAAKVAGSGDVFKNTAEGKAELYKRQLAAIKVGLGEQLMPVYNGFLKTSIQVLSVIKQIDLGNVIKGVAALGATWVAYRIYVLAAAIAQAVENGETVKSILLNKEAGFATKAYIVVKELWTKVTKLATTEMRLFNTEMKISPIGIFLVALGAGVALFSALKSNASQATDELNRQKIAMEETKEVMTKANEAFGEQKHVIDDLVSKIKDHTLSLNERKKALSELIQLDPQYLQGLTLENIETEKGTSLIDNYVNALQRKAVAEAGEETLKDLYKEQIKLNTERTDAVNKHAEAVRKDEEQTKKNLSGKKKSKDEQELSGLDQFTTISQKTSSQADIDAIDSKGKVIIDKIDAVKKAIKQAGNIDDVTFNQSSGLGKFGGKDTVKKSKFDSTDEEIKIQQDLLKAKNDLRNLDIEEQKKYLAQIVDDERNALGLRLSAQKFFTELSVEEEQNNSKAELSEIQVKLAKIAEIEKKSIGKRTDEEKKLLISKKLLLTQSEVIEAKHLEKIDEINLDSAKKIESIWAAAGKKAFDGFVKDVQKLNDDQSTGAIEAQTKAFDDLDAKLKEGKISLEDYQKEHQKLSDKSTIENLKIEEEGLQQLKFAYELFGVDTTDIDKKIAEAHKKIKDAEFKEDVDRLKKLADIKKQVKDKEKQIEQQAFELAKTLFEAGFERTLNRLQGEIDANTKLKDAEIDRINSSTLSEQDKAAKIAQVQAAAQAKEDQLNQKKRAEQLKQAKFERDAQVLSIFGNAIAAHFAIIKQLGVAGIPLAVANDILAGLQIATLLAKPLPKYEQGVDSSPQTWAMTDEAGPEMYIRPDGSMFFGNNQPTLRYLEQGTQIIPHDEIDKVLYAVMMKNTVSALERPIADHSLHQEIKSLRQAVDWQTQELKKSLGKQKSKTVINNRIDTSWGEYINRKVYN
jgi:DNA repair exonuclease SbcCD ATPase subunit